MTNISVPRELLETVLALLREDGNDYAANQLEQFILAKPEEVDPVRVDWGMINFRFNFVAVDEDDECCAYEQEPKMVLNLWGCADPSHSWANIDGLVAIQPGTDWRTTLRKRPEAT